MNGVPSVLGSAVQNTIRLNINAKSDDSTGKQTTGTQGDTATISDQGKALAKAAADADDGGASATIKTNNGKDAAVSKATLTETLQDDKVTQKTIKSKVESAKLQEEANPGSSSDLAKLNVKLNDINATVSKDQVKVNE